MRLVGYTLIWMAIASGIVLGTYWPPQPRWAVFPIVVFVYCVGWIPGYLSRRRSCR
jgi:hypothetical protein